MSLYLVSHVTVFLSHSAERHNDPKENELRVLQPGPGVGDGQLLLLAPDDVDVDGGGADVVRHAAVHSSGVVTHLALSILLVEFSRGKENDVRDLNTLWCLCVGVDQVFYYCFAAHH